MENILFPELRSEKEVKSEAFNFDGRKRGQNQQMNKPQTGQRTQRAQERDYAKGITLESILDPAFGGESGDTKSSYRLTLKVKK